MSSWNETLDKKIDYKYIILFSGHKLFEIGNYVLYILYISMSIHIYPLGWLIVSHVKTFCVIYVEINQYADIWTYKHL